MAFSQILNELPELTFEERQLLIRRAIELDDPPLSRADQTLVENRLAAQEADPGSSIPLEELQARLRGSK